MSGRLQGRVRSPAWTRDTLARVFRSVALVVEKSPERASIAPGPEQLVRWLLHWDEWFRATSRVDAGENLHLHYRRDVTVITDIDTETLIQLRSVGEACREMGVAFSCSVRISDALADAGSLIASVSGGWLQSVTLSHDGEPIASAALRRLLHGLAEHTAQIRLAGSPAIFLKEGVLGDPLLNQLNLSIDPRACRSSFGPPRRTPCRHLMRFFIDSTGDIYPCLGLVGIEAARLGQLEDGFDEARFSAVARDWQLESLANFGPSETDRRAPDRTLGLPHQCEWHRASIAGAEPAIPS